MSAQEVVGTPGPIALISTPADCDPLPTDWLRTFCDLTLRSDWQAIIGPHDPFGWPRTDVGAPVTWLAAMARATIDGDTTICHAVAMREWLTYGAGLGAGPLAAATPAPVQPIARCLTSLRTTAEYGTFSVSDPHETTVGPRVASASVTVTVGADALVHAGAASAPTFDPGVLCDPRITTEDCARIIDAVTAALSQRLASVIGMTVRPAALPWTASASPHPTPSAGQWLGTVVVGLTGSGSLTFEATDVAGQISLMQVDAP